MEAILKLYWNLVQRGHQTLIIHTCNIDFGFGRSPPSNILQYALKYSTRPRQVTSLPLIDLTNKFLGASSLGTSMARYSLNSSSISNNNRCIQHSHLRILQNILSLHLKSSCFHIHRTNALNRNFK